MSLKIKSIYDVIYKVLLKLWCGEYWRLGNIILGERVRIHLSARLSLYRGGRINVGDNTVVCRNVKIASLGGQVELGSMSTIGEYSILLGGAGDLIIEEDVMMADHVRIIAFNHIYSDKNVPIHSQGITSRGVRIGKGSWLGMGVTILDGVHLGRNCVVGAGSVVTKSAPDYSILIGNPARILAKKLPDNSPDV